MSRFIKQPPDAFFKKLQEYSINPEEGRIYNKHGREVFTYTCDGYHTMLIYFGNPTKRRQTKRCHVVWWAFYGRWPTQMLDHKDRNRASDSINNLQESNPVANALNSSLSDRELPHGVYYKCRLVSRPYEAKHKNKTIGYFRTATQAHQAYTTFIEENYL